jgi:anaerobic ribonucleoside-triphosphate reductase activating protein
MKIRLASEIISDSIVDGNGLRTVVWFQGCAHNCINCHNPSSHDFNGGFEKDIDNLIIEILDIDMQTGVTLSGGDPFYQPEACLYLIKKLKEKNINIWCYTGFLYEDLIKSHKEILENIDVLIDGPFIDKLKSYEALFRGSTNQRVIDVQKSLKSNEVILWRRE